MGITGFTFIVFPLCLIWLGRPMRLLHLILIFTIFQASAAFTIGNLGVQSELIPALCFIGFVILQLLLGAKYPGQNYVLRLSIPFIIVSIWGLATSYVLPRAFEDKTYVWPQKSVFGQIPLSVDAISINQDIYLLIDTVFFVIAAMYLTRTKLNLKSIINVYFVSAFLATAVGLWEFANKIAGVPYPEEFFSSNPGFAVLTGQQIGAIPRINGPFSEPAALGGYMAAAVCATGWMLLQGHRQKIIKILFVTGLLMVSLTTSTTGFAVLVISSVLVAFFAFISGSVKLISGTLKIILPVSLLIGFLGFAAATFNPQIITSAEEIYYATVNKQDSSSYQDRTGADLDSLQAVADTYGLGVGWGTNRSSSLIPGLLASVGVPGFLGLLWFGGSITKQVRRARKIANRDDLYVIDGCCGTLFGYLLAGAIAGPEINSVSFYLLLALLIAVAVRVQMYSPIPLKRGSPFRYRRTFKSKIS